MEIFYWSVLDVEDGSFPSLVWFVAWGPICLFFCPCHYFSDQSDKCRYCLARVLPPSPTQEIIIIHWQKINIFATFYLMIFYHSARKWPLSKPHKIWEVCIDWCVNSIIGIIDFPILYSEEYKLKLHVWILLKFRHKKCLVQNTVHHQHIFDTTVLLQKILQINLMMYIFILFLEFAHGCKCEMQNN